MLMMVNVDNITGDSLPFLIDCLFSLGAKNVNACSAITKKGRLGYLIFIDAEPEHQDEIIQYLAQEVGTIGVRILENQHCKMDYTFNHVTLRFPSPSPEIPPLTLTISVKLVTSEGRVMSAKAEYRDLENAVHVVNKSGRPISMSGLRALVELAALKNNQSDLAQVEVEVESF